MEKITKRSITEDLINAINQQTGKTEESSLMNYLQWMASQNQPAYTPPPQNVATPVAKSAQANPALQTTKDANTQILQRYGGLRQ